jgi:hypothetical protein
MLSWRQDIVMKISHACICQLFPWLPDADAIELPQAIGEAGKKPDGSALYIAPIL